MPVHGYHPFAAIEDREAGVFWGATLAWPGSWQMELYRRDDQLSLSGGLADRELGHWFKNLAPGETFTSPQAYVTTVKGNFDDLCQRLTAMQSRPAEQAPDSEQALPVLVNEFCTTWGNPTHERVCALARRLNGSGVKYFVIDAGWYRGENGDWSLNQGEWAPSQELFPHGIAATAKFIREQGLIPGLWFEFEVVGSQSKLFDQMADHFLKRDGIPISAGQRRFWDFRDPWVRDYLHEKIVLFLQETGFGYIKVDYNETIGMGVDGAETLGEGLRQHLMCVQDFFREMRKELPDLVIEDLRFGRAPAGALDAGTRQYGFFFRRSRITRNPDYCSELAPTHIYRDNPRFGPFSTPLIHLSVWYIPWPPGSWGDCAFLAKLMNLTESNGHLCRKLLVSTIGLHRSSRMAGAGFISRLDLSWQHPQGAQAVLRTSMDDRQALLVLHTFARPLPVEIDPRSSS